MMSEYEIPAKKEKFTLIVGWDEELKTYFMRVTDLTQNGRIIDQAGRCYGEIGDLEVLDALVKKYSKAPDGLSPKMYKTLFDEDDPYLDEDIDD